jgi:hypothetical protein
MNTLGEICHNATAVNYQVYAWMVDEDIIDNN